MRPGISIQHGNLPNVRGRFVRCDIGALLGFLPRARWPDGAAAGDFIELVARRAQDLEQHPQRFLFDPATRRAARAFFENGGDTLHLFATCIEGEEDLFAPSDSDGPLQPLFTRLQTEEDIALLAVPMAAYLRCEIRRGVVNCQADALYRLLLLHCRQMTNRFLIIDAPRGLHGDHLQAWAERFRSANPEIMGFGALYYPWLIAGDEVMPPSGAIMGLFARAEHEHAPMGIGWPPANMPLLGVTHTEVELDWPEAGALGELSINPLIVQAGRGVVVWGARTLSKDASWMFINSRRVVNMIAEQLRRDNEWTIFEVNDPSLWMTIERDIRVRLEEFWRAGLISGSRSDGDFSVQCDEETNPADQRDSGSLNVRVQLRPVGTTERILIDLRLSQSAP